MMRRLTPQDYECASAIDLEWRFLTGSAHCYRLLDKKRPVTPLVKLWRDSCSFHIPLQLELEAS